MKVSDLKVGDIINTNIGNCIFANKQNRNGESLFISLKPVGYLVKFDDGLTFNYNKSKLNNYLNDSIYKSLVNEFGIENVLPHFFRTSSGRNTTLEEYYVRAISYGEYINYSKYFEIPFKHKSWTCDPDTDLSSPEETIYSRVIDKDGSKTKERTTNMCRTIICFSLSKNTEVSFSKTKTKMVWNEMIIAKKQHNTMRNNTLSMLLQALQRAEKDKIGTSLTDAEADAVVMKEIKQTQETLDTCPANRTDIIEECEQRIAILQEFAPKQLDKEEIEALIREVFAEIGIESPAKKDKGKVMKVLMPKVKGKADGKLVNQILDGMMA